jgi:Domain of unknown function (DUF4389)
MEGHMSQPDASYTGPEGSSTPLPAERPAFPWQRFFFSVMFAVLGWVAFWITIVLAIVLWVLIAVSREPHPEFKQFVNASARYVWQCLAYVVLMREEKPFPLGPLPRGDAD